MKTQLLEDIGESIPPPDPPLQQTDADPGDGTRLPAAAPAPSTRRPGTWRKREAPAAPPPPPPPLFNADVDPLAECWAIANPDTGPTRFERWGRRTAIWSAGLAALLLVAGGAAWIVNERMTDEALATVAAIPLPAPPAVTRAAIEPSEPALLQASELALPVPELHAGLPVFAAAPQPAKPVRRRALAEKKAPTRPSPHVPDPAQVRAAQTAETLRQCRAAGYHAKQCLERSCVATPYGIACKG